ncbi:MAG: hypothetical protein V4813_14895 [Gemmatimonadota bacterium]
MMLFIYFAPAIASLLCYWRATCIESELLTRVPERQSTGSFGVVGPWSLTKRDYFGEQHEVRRKTGLRWFIAANLLVLAQALLLAFLSHLTEAGIIASV